MENKDVSQDNVVSINHRKEHWTVMSIDGCLFLFWFQRDIQLQPPTVHLSLFNIATGTCSLKKLKLSPTSFQKK